MSAQKTLGRKRKQGWRKRTPVQRSPYIKRNIGNFDILSDDGLCLIEQNAEAILRDVEMEFHDDEELLELWREAGADVQGVRVRFGPGMCRSIVQATAPCTYTQHARNPENNIILGGNNTVLAPSWGPPLWKEQLEAYQEPALDADKLEALEAYVHQRKESVEDRWY